MKPTTKKIFYFLGILFIGGVTVFNVTLFAKVQARQEKIYQELKKFTQIMDLVKDNYVKPVKEEELIEGAIKGMISSLDPFSSYMTRDEFKEMQIETKGEYGGLGIEITVLNGVLTVVAPIEDTPAYRAGIQAGDKILEIDGKSTRNMTLTDAVKLMRGPKGTKVVLTIFREGKPEPFKVEITRDIIHIKAVKKMNLDGVLYIKLKQFQEGAGKEIMQALKASGLLKGKHNGNIAGVILDLRNNPGGLLDEAVSVADDFLKQGTIVYTKDRSGVKNIFEAHDDGWEADFPLIVLVNKGSASAAEIVSGALRDNKRAVIMGEKTFGKASVQTIFPLQDGAAIRLTTAYYYTPSGKLIHGEGIKPDIPLHEEVPRTTLEEFVKKSFEERVREDPAVRRAYELIKAWNVFAAHMKNNVSQLSSQ